VLFLEVISTWFLRSASGQTDRQTYRSRHYTVLIAILCTSPGGEVISTDATDIQILVACMVGRVDRAFDSCLKDIGSNPAEVSHCVKTVGKLFTTIVLSGGGDRLNQLTSGI